MVELSSHDSARNDAAVAFVVTTIAGNAWLGGSLDTLLDARGRGGGRRHGGLSRERMLAGRRSGPMSVVESRRWTLAHIRCAN